MRVLIVCKEMSNFQSLFVTFALLLTVVLICTPTISSLKWPMRSSKSLTRLSATYKVTVKHDGLEKVLEVDENTSILEACLDAGIDMKHGCKLGGCQTCTSKIISGIVDQSDGSLDESLIDEGYALICSSYPRSDVVIRSIDDDELIKSKFKD